VIRILDHVQTYSTYEDGEVIYQLIAKELRDGRNVTLSFFGIKSIPSAFVNAALVKLIEEFDFDYIRSRLKIVDSTRQINRLVKDRFHFATKERVTSG
jgi:hypothetical protein